MFKHLLSISLLATACGAVVAPSNVDPTDPAEPTCANGQTCSCTAGAFLGCVGDNAQTCNAGGNGAATEACGAPGCNETAGRCNSCEPDSVTCSSDATALEHCGADGLPAVSEACAAGCVDGKDGKPAHCAYLEPTFLPDVCDAPATLAAFTPSADATIDTSLDAVCTGGIVTQASGPEICVIRYGTIEITTRLTVRGARAVAFVADHDLLMRGTLDVSADGASNGPGGGAVISGARAQSNAGGGGAGFRSNGADGGGFDPAGGGVAGAALDPLAPIRFVGGGRPALPTFQQSNYPVSGGGGGALMLIACRGSVSVTGTIDAGGGGGGGGRDADLSAGTVYAGGAGGGAGGYVALQGIDVRVSGGGVFANGGAGGGGCSVNGCIGTPGGDARPSATIAQGGVYKDEGGTGGNGGTDQAPTKGQSTYKSPGGGGGAAGRLQVFKPANGTVSISTTTSPAFEADRTIQLR